MGVSIMTTFVVHNDLEDMKIDDKFTDFRMRGYMLDAMAAAMDIYAYVKVNDLRREQAKADGYDPDVYYDFWQTKDAISSMRFARQSMKEHGMSLLNLKSVIKEAQKALDEDLLPDMPKDKLKEDLDDLKFAWKARH